MCKACIIFAKIGIDIDSSGINSRKSYSVQELHTVVFISCVLKKKEVQNQICVFKNEFIGYICIYFRLNIFVSFFFNLNYFIFYKISWGWAK